MGIWSIYECYGRKGLDLRKYLTRMSFPHMNSKGSMVLEEKESSLAIITALKTTVLCFSVLHYVRVED